MNKTLPVELNACIKTECWTYMRMCIIQAMENYEKWLYTHMTAFIDCNTHTSYFGDYTKVHSPDYYRDILETEELSIFSLPCEDIVEFITNNIDNDYYISVFIRNESDYNHEVFIYGYDDDSKCFASIALSNEGGFKLLLLIINMLKRVTEDLLSIIQQILICFFQEEYIIIFYHG